jgi:glycine betaine transporter
MAIMARRKPGNRIRKLLVATDFSAGSRAALQTVEKLCSAGDRMELNLVHVLEPLSFTPPPPPFWIDYEVRREREARRLLDRLATRVRRKLGANVRVKTHVLPGAAYAAICRLAAKLAPDLIVVGTHGRTGMKHALLGSVAERVVRHAKRPVVTVPIGGRART